MASTAASPNINPLAPDHLPMFITAPGQTDVMMVVTAVILLLIVFLLGTLYFRLHALPEHLAHGKASKLQFEIVGVLALLALFTHNSIFWVAALLLALVPVPDLNAPLAAMADSLARIAGWRRPVVAETVEVRIEEVVEMTPAARPDEAAVVEPVLEEAPPPEEEAPNPAGRTSRRRGKGEP